MILFSHLAVLVFIALTNAISYQCVNEYENMCEPKYTVLGGALSDGGVCHNRDYVPEKPSQHGILDKLLDIIPKEKRQKAQCSACKITLNALKGASNDGQWMVNKVLRKMCRKTSRTKHFTFLNALCTNMRQYNAARPVVDHFSFLPDLMNALSEMDIDGIDGEYMCHYIFSSSCERPRTPKIDYSKYWTASPGNQPGNVPATANYGGCPKQTRPGCSNRPNCRKKGCVEYERIDESGLFEPPIEPEYEPVYEPIYEPVIEQIHRKGNGKTRLIPVKGAPVKVNALPPKSLQYEPLPQESVCPNKNGPVAPFPNIPMGRFRLRERGLPEHVDRNYKYNMNTDGKNRFGGRNTFKVLHLSDVHLSLNYSANTPANCLGLMCCLKDSFQNPLEEALPAPKYGYWRCDAPPQLLESAMADCSKMDYAFALFTGDMVDHNPALISRKNTMLEEETTLRTMKNYLPKIPIYPVLGNHDSFPYSQEPAPNSVFRDRTARHVSFMQKLWNEYGWVTGDSSRKVQLRHGGYATEPLPGLKVISLNSNYWYRWNFYNYINISDPDMSGTLQFLIDELLDCERRGIKAWLQAHVPPGGVATEALPPQANMLVAILERFNDVISGLFFGHTHHDEFIVMYANNATQKSEENALQVVNIGPSITPFSDLNPGWRYYEIDSETFEVMDVITVYADIEPGFRKPWACTPNLKWEPLFSVREKYGKAVQWPLDQPLNGKFWHRVSKMFLMDSGIAEQYVRHSYRNSTRAPKCLTEENQADLYCYSTSMTPDQVIQCDHDMNVRVTGVCNVPKFPMPKPIKNMFHGE